MKLQDGNGYLRRDGGESYGAIVFFVAFAILLVVAGIGLFALAAYQVGFEACLQQVAK